MKFRTDINGLRAIAVIGVVLFHFNASWVPGGFSGVDVFFVISGFLMTGIIFGRIEKENFSILPFYAARAKRIIPALAVLCLALLLFSFFILSPDEQYKNSKHILGSMAFISNIIYWRESGYFDASSLEKWLLHTWSLSVEWQFYIIYPLVLVAMRKFMPVKVMKLAVLLGTVLGFVFCVIATYKWATPAYYLLPTRAWEMMVGGVAYLYPIYLKEERKKLLEWFGLALIIGSYFFISKDTPWPGYLAILPVLGSFLIIQAQRNDSLITSNAISQKIGAWSYSIYLWHWPLVVAIYYYSLSDVFIYVGLILSLLIGSISYHLIEVKKFNTLTLIQIFVLISATSIMFINSKMYIEERDYVQYAKPNENSGFCTGIEKHCSSYGNENKKDLILWGDSHSVELGKYLGSKGYNLVVYSTSGCPPINKARRADGLGNATNCNNKINDSIFDKINEVNGIDNLVLISRWSLYNYGWLKKGKLQNETHYICFNDCENINSHKSFENLKVGLKETLSILDDKYSVFIFNGGPILKVNGTEYSGRAEQELSLNEHRDYNKPTSRMLEELADKKGYTLLSHDELFFDKEYLVVRYKDRLLFKDDNHPTYFGWDYVFRSFKREFDSSILRQ